MTNNYTTLSDRCLIERYQNSNPACRNEIMKEFLRRYNNQINKNWWILSRQFNHSSLVNSVKDEYYSEAIEALYTAVEKINLDKIRDDNWKLLQYSSFYIRNVRTRLIKKITRMAMERPLNNLAYYSGGDETKENKIDPETEMKYESTEGYKNNPETIYIEKEISSKLNAIFSSHYANWDDTYRAVFDAIKVGDSKKVVAEKAGININKLARILRKIKAELTPDLKKAGIA